MAYKTYDIIDLCHSRISKTPHVIVYSLTGIKIIYMISYGTTYQEDDQGKASGDHLTKLATIVVTGFKQETKHYNSRTRSPIASCPTTYPKRVVITPSPRLQPSFESVECGFRRYSIQ